MHLFKHLFYITCTISYHILLFSVTCISNSLLLFIIFAMRGVFSRQLTPLHASKKAVSRSITGFFTFSFLTVTFSPVEYDREYNKFFVSKVSRRAAPGVNLSPPGFRCSFRKIKETCTDRSLSVQVSDITVTMAVKIHWYFAGFFKKRALRSGLCEPFFANRL